MRPGRTLFRVLAVLAVMVAGTGFLSSLAGCQNRERASVLRVLDVVWGEPRALPPATEAEIARFDLALAEAAPADPAALERERGHFRDAVRQVRGDYVHAVEDARLVDAALKGLSAVPEGERADAEKAVAAALDAMLVALDPHSGYLDPDQLAEMHVATSGRFGGLGIEITQEEGAVKIVSPIEGTPAARAGLRPGDRIVALDGASLGGLPLGEAVRRMRGEPGTRIVLTVARAGVSDFDVTIVRDLIRIDAVRWRLEGDVGYVRVASFSENADEGARAALEALRREAGGGLSGVILDLRRNPGGLLEQSQAVADDFLDRGVIVSVRGRRERLNRTFEARDGDIARGLPMVVLIDGGSASAAEIVASALQENGRAVVMGRRSYGKGSVQTVVPLPLRGAVKLTTQLYYAPSGRTIQGRGVNPDIVLESGEPNPFPREADLPGALAAEQPEDRPSRASVPLDRCPPVGEKGEDRALGCALAYLQAGGETAFLAGVGGVAR